jgi:hypothetical protein
MTDNFAADGTTRVFHVPDANASPLVRAQDFHARHKRHVDLHEAQALAQGLSRAGVAEASPEAAVNASPTSLEVAASIGARTVSPKLLAGRRCQMATEIEGGACLQYAPPVAGDTPHAPVVVSDVRPASPAPSLVDTRRTYRAELLHLWCAETDVRLASCSGGRVTSAPVLRTALIELFRQSPTRSLMPRLTQSADRYRVDREDQIAVDAWATMHDIRWIVSTHGLVTATPVHEAALAALLTTPSPQKASAGAPASKLRALQPPQDEELLDLHLETRDEISRIKRPSGTTIFNPAVTQLVNQASSRPNAEDLVDASSAAPAGKLSADSILPSPLHVDEHMR